MKELLLEYKKTRLETQKLLEELQVKYDNLRFSKGRDLINKLNAEELTLLHRYEEDLSIIRNWLSNINYSIQWLKSGRQPGKMRGVERRASYEREVPFDPYWIQLKVEKSSYDNTDIEDNDEFEDYKEDLVKQMIKPLNKTEKEIIELSAKEFSIRDISNYLHIPKSTVSDTLIRCKRKIENEGWVIV